MTIAIWARALIAPTTCAIGLILYHDVCHAAHVPWNSNWDQREFLYQASSSYTGAACIKASRNIFLVRHGHYFPYEDGLSCLGKEQSAIVGRRLQEFNFDYEAIYFAGLQRRSYETSEIIAQYLQGVESIPCSMIHKGDPIIPVPAFNWNPDSHEQILEDGCRLEDAFHKYCFRPDADQRTDSYEIIVLPANVIRYFVCRAMQFPPEAWQRFSLFNCSITWLRIGKEGTVTVRTFGDFGHIPHTKLTPSL